MIGRTLGHYRIVEPLGAGGMGEVYRAHDEKLDRDVALKVLPEGSLSDPEARKRFQREANALSRLSHPHIATIHDFDTADGVDFLVMELVKGPSLRDELEDKGALPEKTVVRLGAQLARGLQAAHEQGIVHRDLKPGNLQLTPDGLLKILDFGLARLLPKEAPGDETAPTQTAVGRVAGTLLYMSPEQLRGRGVDARTDLYAAGAVLYEMATGRRLFSKASSAELTEAILSEDPKPPRDLQESVSPGLEAVIVKALDKDPELRYQTAKDLHVDLERLQLRSDSRPSGSGTLATSPVRAVRHRWRWGIAAILAATVLGATAWVLWPARPPRVTNARALSTGLDANPPSHIASSTWATDGVRVYYLGMKEGRSALFQIPVTGGEVAELPLPFPYHNRIYDYAKGESALLMQGHDREGHSLYEGVPVWMVPVPAGAPSRVGSLQTWRAAMSPDGQHIATVEAGAIVVAGRDGAVENELGPLPTQPIDLTWGPDSRRIRFTAPGPDRSRQFIWEIAIDDESPRPLWPGERGRWSGDGKSFVFARPSDVDLRSDLYALVERRTPWAPLPRPVRLTFGPLSFSDPGTSPDGKRLFAWGTSERGELLRLDPGSGGFERYLDGISAIEVDSTDDGSRVAYVSYPERALWSSRPDGTDRLRLTPPEWLVSQPRWSQDGEQIVFVGPDGLYVTRRHGGEPELVLRGDTPGDSFWDPCFLQDGETVVYSYAQSANPGIHRLDLVTGKSSLVAGAESLQYPKCSPRGDLLAYGRSAEGHEDGPPFWLRRAGKDEWELIGHWSAGYQDWSRDGESVFALNAEANRLERWSRATGRIEEVADIGSIPLLTRWGTPWMGLAHDGSPLIVRDLSTRDLYTFDWEAP